MPRLNIEESIHSDFRFKSLSKKLANEDTAMGMLVRFWWIAQKYWADGRKLVPLSVFKREGFGPILECGLATRHLGGIYSHGASSQFEWLATKVENGRKGGLKRALMAKQNEANPSESKPLTLTPTLTPSLTLTQIQEEDSSDPKATLPVEAPNIFKNPKLAKILQDRKVTPQTQIAWLDAYPDMQWIAQVVFQALAWEAANPQKRKKQFGRFITNWLARDCDKHTSALPSNPQRSTDDRGDENARPRHPAVEATIRELLAKAQVRSMPKEDS